LQTVSTTLSCLLALFNINCNQLYHDESFLMYWLIMIGVAPGAKVAFFDMQDSSKGYLSAPQNLATSLFSPLYSSGARVFSNSYGGGTYYTSSCYDVDYFSYNNPDSLIIFAAGNSGKISLLFCFQVFLISCHVVYVLLH
jgi:hypothetical protein